MSNTNSFTENQTSELVYNFGILEDFFEGMIQGKPITPSELSIELQSIGNALINALATLQENSISFKVERSAMSGMKSLSYLCELFQLMESMKQQEDIKNCRTSVIKPDFDNLKN